MGNAVGDLFHPLDQWLNAREALKPREEDTVLYNAHCGSEYHGDWNNRYLLAARRSLNDACRLPTRAMDCIAIFSRCAGFVENRGKPSTQTR